MNEYNKITALYSRLSVGDEDRDGGESNSIVNQKAFLERYAQQQRLTNIRHYIDDDESGRFFDRSAYSRMMEDVENGKIGVCIMKDLTRWGRDYLQVGNAMEVFRRNNVRFIAVNNGIDSDNPDTLEFAPFINIMSEWYAKDISKKVKTGIRTKGASGKPIATEAPYGYMKDPNNKDFWIIDEEAAEVVRLIFRLFIGGKNRNQIAVYLKNEQILTPTFYLKQHDRGTAKSRPLNEENRYKWNKATLTKILTRQEYCGDVVNFKTTKHFRDKRNHYVDIWSVGRRNRNEDFEMSADDRNCTGHFGVDAFCLALHGADLHIRSGAWSTKHGNCSAWRGCADYLFPAEWCDFAGYGIFD